MRIAGLDIEDGKVFDLALQPVPTPPSFSADERGTFFFSLSDKILRFNDGEKLVPLNTTISENPNLKSSLGANWLNADLSFNPSPFNALPGISGLASTDSLFTVIDQLADLISNLSTFTLSDIEVDEPYPDMTVVAHLSGDLILVSIEQVLEGSIISLTFDNLEGFNISDTTLGHMIVFNDEDELVSQKVNHKYTNFTSSATHLITHNLGKKHCSVFCINPATDEMIVPTKIKFESTTQLIVTLPSALPLVAIVTSLEPPT